MGCEGVEDEEEEEEDDDEVGCEEDEEVEEEEEDDDEEGCEEDEEEDRDALCSTSSSSLPFLRSRFIRASLLAMAFWILASLTAA